MGLKSKDINTRISRSSIKDCRAKEETIVFSFEYLTDDKRYSFEGLGDKKDRTNCVNSFMKALRLLSSKTWTSLGWNKWSGGVEVMYVDSFKPAFKNALKHVSEEEGIYILRFNSEKSRLFFRRGTRCGRVAQILGVEFKLGDAYDHGE